MRSKREAPLTATSPDEKSEERERCWRIICVDHPDVDEYQKHTDRRIPLVVLNPR
jgi:hypothetical protein